MTIDAADGYTALFRSSPFLDRAGPFYSKGKGQSLSIGRTLAFANVYLLLGEARIVRASGVFAVTSKD